MELSLRLRAAQRVHRFQQNGARIHTFLTSASSEGEWYDFVGLIEAFDLCRTSFTEVCQTQNGIYKSCITQYH